MHCHNDYGLATACVLAAYEGGADVLHCSVNGVGYRAGGAALEEVVMALEALYGVRTGVRLERLAWLSRVTEEITGIPVGYFKGVTGTGRPASSSGAPPPGWRPPASGAAPSRSSRRPSGAARRCSSASGATPRRWPSGWGSWASTSRAKR